MSQLISAYAVNQKGELYYSGLPKDSKHLLVCDHAKKVYKGRDGVEYTLKQEIIEGLDKKGLAVK